MNFRIYGKSQKLPLYIKLKTPKIHLTIGLSPFYQFALIQLNSYLKRIGVLCEEQSGFREGHSTVTAVTDITEFKYKNMDQGQPTGAVFLDLKKAFDTVDAETLLFKLKCLGINNTEQAWFLNYLIDRVQCVSFSGDTSQECYVSCDVPQGSILGPLHFVIYINNFIQSINLCNVVLYADDTILLFAHKDPDIIKHTLETDLEGAQHWFNCNKLNLNVSKCKWMMFGTIQRLKSTKATDLFIGENPLKKVKNFKYLSVCLVLYIILEFK